MQILSCYLLHVQPAFCLFPSVVFEVDFSSLFSSVFKTELHEEI